MEAIEVEIERVVDVVVNEKTSPIIQQHEKISRQAEDDGQRPNKRHASSTLGKIDDSLVEVHVLFFSTSQVRMKSSKTRYIRTKKIGLVFSILVFLKNYHR